MITNKHVYKAGNVIIGLAALNTLVFVVVQIFK
jgi:hypothetical protein